MTSLPLVSIVVLCYNGGKDLVRCVESLSSTNYPQMEVILVDNMSSDGSVDDAALSYPSARVVKNTRNLGYAGGMNAGIKASTGEYVVLLNQDTILTEDWLRCLVEGAERRLQSALFQPKLLSSLERREIDSVGNQTHILGFGLTMATRQVDRGQFDTEVEIAHPSGACILARRRVIEEVGLLDSTYFLYHEDTDWAWRARLFGWRAHTIPSSVVIHRHKFTLSPSKFYFLERNRLMTLLKNYSGRTLTLLSVLLISFEIGIIALSFLRGLGKAKINSYADLLRLRGYVRSERRRLQLARTHGDTFAMSVFTTDLSQVFFSALARGASQVCSLYLRFIRNSIR